LSDLFSPLVVIDIAARAAQNPDSVVSPDDILEWERRHGPMPHGACVAMKSGWDRLLHTPKYVNRDDLGLNHTPGFHPETADLLIHERDVRGLAVDTLSLDTGLSSTKDFPVHYAWLGSGRWGIEAIANLDAVAESGATIFVGAAKVRGGTGGPCRVVAFQ